jgi:hypothetical protein
MMIVFRISWLCMNSVPDIKANLSKVVQNRRLKIFKEICSKSWISLYQFLTSLPINNFDGYSRPSWELLTEMTSFGHKQLGRVGLCAGSDGAFLKICVRHLSEYKLPHSQMFQCYKCLYGTVVKIDNDHVLEDHDDTRSLPFGKEPAARLFEIIEPFFRDKISSNSYGLISKEMIQCLQMVTDVYPEPPFDYGMFFLQRAHTK